MTSLILESKILDNKKNLKNYQELFQIAKDNLAFILGHQSNQLIHIYQLDDEMNSYNFELAILRAFLDCKYYKF